MTLRSRQHDGRAPQDDARAVHHRGACEGQGRGRRRICILTEQRRQGREGRRRRKTAATGDGGRKDDEDEDSEGRRGRCAGRQGAGEDRDQRGARGRYRLDRAGSSSAFARWARTRTWSIDFKFQNVPFVLNILDSLAGDDRFVDLRKRTRSHRILTKVEEATEDQRKTSLDEQRSS